MSSKSRVIKKYPNRRLYDTEVSKYITLDDIRQLVEKHIHFRVVDVRSEKDLTRNTLLQIMVEREENGHAKILTSDILQNLIRLYATSADRVSQFLDEKIKGFNAEPQRQQPPIFDQPLD